MSLPWTRTVCKRAHGRHGLSGGQRPAPALRPLPCGPYPAAKSTEPGLTPPNQRTLSQNQPLSPQLPRHLAPVTSSALPPPPRVLSRPPAGPRLGQPPALRNRPEPPGESEPSPAGHSVPAAGPRSCPVSPAPRRGAAALGRIQGKGASFLQHSQRRGWPQATGGCTRLGGKARFSSDLAHSPFPMRLKKGCKASVTSSGFARNET